MLVGRARLVGVFDPQQELAALVAGVQPVEERRAGASDVEITRGRGGEPNSDGVSHELLRNRRMSNAQCPMSNFEICHWTFDIGHLPFLRRGGFEPPIGVLAPITV